MFSLTVIFLNVVVAANDFPTDEKDAMSTILVLMNIVMLVIIAGTFVCNIVITWCTFTFTRMKICFVFKRVS